MGKKKRRAIALRNQKALEYASIPLLEMFATADDVFTEANAFEPDTIHKSLGRLYRTWLDVREQLDPDFNREHYRHEMKARRPKPTTPLGRKRLVLESPTTSTDPKPISEKSPKKSGKNAKPSAKRSVPPVQSNDHASSGRSKKKSRSESGEGSRRESGSASLSGSKNKASERSQKKKD